MLFSEEKAIYIQIAEYVMDKILKDEWISDSKILSVRDLTAELEVNPNTVMRAYDNLQQQEIIYNKRGLGFFVNLDAKSKIQTQRKSQFLEVELPSFFNSMDLLSISIEDIVKHYQTRK